MPKIRVLIADDHALVREGLKQLMSEQPDLEVVGEAEDGYEALEKVRSLEPDIAVLDIAMPRLGGLEAVSLIREISPRTRMVVLSMHAKESYVHKVLSSGALGYVLKASPISDVLTAVRAAHKGEYFLSSKISAEVVGSYLRSASQPPPAKGYDLLVLANPFTRGLEMMRDAVTRIARDAPCDVLLVRA